MLSLTAKINSSKDVRVFDAGTSKGFSVNLGKKYYDFKEKANKWTNYKLVVFAKDKQASFYESVLVPGTIVSCNADDLKVDNYNPEYPVIELINAKIDNVFTNDSNQSASKPEDDNLPF